MRSMTYLPRRCRQAGTMHRSRHQNITCRCVLGNNSHYTHFLLCLSALFKTFCIVGERYYVIYVRLMAWAVRLSYVCPSCCCALPRRLNFSEIFLHRLIAYRDWAVCDKILKKIPWGSRWLCKLNGRGVWKVDVFDRYLALFRKRRKTRPGE